jgi:dephospho-CoA kinase
MSANIYIHTTCSGKTYFSEFFYNKKYDYVSHDKHCPCGKDVYETYNKAIKALKQRGKSRYEQKDVYQCHICGNYHFTSKDRTKKDTKMKKYNIKERRKKIIVYEVE